MLYGADDQKKILHLQQLQPLGELKIFGADLTVEGSFDDPIAGCDLVFHVATPVHFASEDPEVQIKFQILLKTLMFKVFLVISNDKGYLGLFKYTYTERHDQASNPRGTKCS